ncbi:MAG: glycosyltransferase family 2 protein [Proteobacteria bacterium]|nr:glycosyltransferase family 2 protein [Pseudomonadota bacterium]
MENPGTLAVVTVTYHPDVARLRLQFDALPADCRLVLVDNASDAAAVAEIERLVEARKNSVLLRNTENAGLGAALNQGAAHALQVSPTLDFLLLMDQDSVPRQGAVAELMRAFLALEASGARVGGVGPRLIDESTNLQHGFHTVCGWLLRRVFPSEDSTTAIDCLGINGSGTLVRAALFRELGGLEADFFIDQIDTEWSFRTRAAGYRSYGIPQARFDHCMGERGVAWWFFGWHVWPHRSPHRHYYLFRNALRLYRRPYVPRVWKFWNVIKLSATFCIHGLFDTQRKAQMANMLRGVRDGLLRPDAAKPSRPPGTSK